MITNGIVNFPLKILWKKVLAVFVYKYNTIKKVHFMKIFLQIRNGKSVPAIGLQIGKTICCEVLQNVSEYQVAGCRRRSISKPP